MRLLRRFPAMAKNLDGLEARTPTVLAGLVFLHAQFRVTAPAQWISNVIA